MISITETQKEAELRKKADLAFLSNAMKKLKAGASLSFQERMILEEKLANYVGTDESVTLHQYEEMYACKTEKVYLTGFSTIDGILGGVAEEELIIITGNEGCGKSTLCKTIAMNLIDKYQMHCYFFSYEMNPSRLFRGIDPKYRSYLCMPAQIVDNISDWIELKVYEARIKFGAKVFFIDHLHYLFSLGDSGNASLKIGDVVRQLKRIAVRHSIIIFLVVHLSYAGHLRDSKLIIGESDIILRIARSESDDGQGELTIDKSRREGIIKRTVNITLEGRKFYEAELTRKDIEITDNFRRVD